MPCGSMGHDPGYHDSSSDDVRAAAVRMCHACGPTGATGRAMVYSMQAAGEWTHQDHASRMQGSGVVHGIGTGMEDPSMGVLQDGMLVHVLSDVCTSAIAAYRGEHVVECSAWL